MEDKYREQRQELELQLNVSALEHYDHHIFIEDLTDFAYSCHRLAVEKGFWEENGKAVKGLKIALIHSEVSEVLEATREPQMQGHLSPEFTLEEEELADILIRTLDYAAAYNLRLPEALLAKHEYNKGRPFKHGKEF